MLDSLCRLLGCPRRPVARRKTKPRVVPSLEALEDRWVPSAANTLSVQALLGGSVGGLSGTPITVVTPPSSTSGPSQGPSTPATQTQEVDATFGAFTTGGSQSQTVAQFNPSLGTLTGVQIILNGQLTSDVKVENLDGAPSNVSAQVNGNLSLQGPGFNSLAVNPSISENATLSSYDGATDFSGPGGHDFGPQSAQASQSVTLSAGDNDLSAWVGGGTVSLTENAQSSSTLTGSGNQVSQINTTGGGTVQVIYSYTPAPPSTPPPTVPPPVTPPLTTPSTPPATTPPVDNCTPPTNPGSLAGIVYIDPNHTGQYTAGDPGVPGVSVNLTGTTLTGQSVSQTAQTGADGSYRFTGLQPGVYTLSDVQPPSFTAGAENLGNLGGVVQGDQMIVALPQGGDGHCYDFGELPPAPPPLPPNSGVTPTLPPNDGVTPQAPPSNPPPSNTPPDSPPTTTPVVLSKRFFVGDGWQSLG